VRASRSVLGVLAIAYALAHIPYLVSTLEDIDSVNFALGIRDFDVAQHRPHPPGYPVYIGLGKTGAAILRFFDAGETSAIEARTLSILSLIGAIASAFLLYRTMACWSAALADPDDRVTPPWQSFDTRALAATALALACPLMWYLGVRPMSDVPGLAAAIAAQAALGLAWWRQQSSKTVRNRFDPHRLAASGRMIVLGSLLAGIAIGFRSQNAVLTLPLLAGVLFDRIGRGVAGALIGSSVALAVGALAWFVPLVVVSGGIDAYLAALGSQAGEDFAGVEMLYLNPTPRLATFALVRTFLYPWDSLVLGGIVIALAAIGAVTLLVRDRRGLTIIALVSVPYLVFHLAFQDTNFVRYALPLVPPTVYLAVCGLEATVRRAALPVAGAVALWSVATAAPVLALYGSEQSPTARVVSAMQDALANEKPGALAFHQAFRRPLEAERVMIEPRLPSPPRREWLELNRYWREGHTAPVWFLADPTRSDLALVDPRSRSTRADFTWGFKSLSDIGGMRPAAVGWYRMAPPGWFADEGWALTPETAGIARLMGRGPSLGPITASVRRRNEPVHLVIGGRNLGSPADPAATFSVAVDGRPVGQWDARPGFFIEEFDLSADELAGEGSFAQLTIESRAPIAVPTAIEQFDLQSVNSLMWVYDEGWQEAEYNSTVGMWRWTSDRSTLRIINASTPVTITMRVERPTRYFDRHPTVRMKAANLVLGETHFDGAELWSVTVPLDHLHKARGRIVIETDLTFVPAERSGVTDRRRLGLRVFGVNVSAQP
jgi:hypothetical protein